MKSFGIYALAGVGVIALAGLGVYRVGLDISGKVSQAREQRSREGSQPVEQMVRGSDLGRLHALFERASRGMPVRMLDAIARNEALVVDASQTNDAQLMATLAKLEMVRQVEAGQYERSYRVDPSASLVLAMLAGQHVRTAEPSGASQEVQRMWRQL